MGESTRAQRRLARKRERKPRGPAMAGKHHANHQQRCRRLARHLVWHGTGLPGDDDDYLGGVTWPRHLMTERQASDVSRWAVATPNRWWCRVTVFCEDADHRRYQEVAESETSQACLVNEMSHWRIGLLEQAKARCNPKYIVLEKFETGVIA